MASTSNRTLTAIQSVKRLFRWSSWKELHFPLILPLIPSAIVLAFNITLGQHAARILQTSVTLGALTTTCVCTSFSILMAMDNSFIRRIRKTKYIKQLKAYVRDSLISSVFLSVLSLIALSYATFIESSWFASIWYFNLGFCVACLWRLLWLMLVLFESPDS